jgi:hypothetical protein
MTELSHRVDVSDILIKNENQFQEVSTKNESQFQEISNISTKNENQFQENSKISENPPPISGQEVKPFSSEEKLKMEKIFYVRLDFAKFDEDYIQVKILSKIWAVQNKPGPGLNMHRNCYYCIWA